MSKASVLIERLRAAVDARAGLRFGQSSPDPDSRSVRAYRVIADFEAVVREYLPDALEDDASGDRSASPV